MPNFESWNESTVIYNAAELAQSGSSIQREKNLFAFEVTNVGDTTVFFNDKPLYAGVPGTSIGDSIAEGDPNGKIYKGTLRIRFGTPLGVLPQVEVCQLFYV